MKCVKYMKIYFKLIKTIDLDVAWNFQHIWTCLEILVENNKLIPLYIREDGSVTIMES